MTLYLASNMTQKHAFYNIIVSASVGTPLIVVVAFELRCYLLYSRKYCCQPVEGHSGSAKWQAVGCWHFEEGKACCFEGTVFPISFCYG